MPFGIGPSGIICPALSRANIPKQVISYYSKTKLSLVAGYVPVKYTSMIKKLLLIIFCVFFYLNQSSFAYAVENPLSVPNNSFGIHIQDENDLEDAASLVNSSGGDWGYVTIVIRKDERNTLRWQGVFDKMRRLHLIPIIRIATAPINGGWEKPNFDDIDSWVSFLNSLNWVVKNRYLVIGNEPNHAKEWGGEINPAEYASYLEIFTQKLKAFSGDFFVLPAGFDSSAPTDTRKHMGEETFLAKMIEAKPNIFENVDGWASHSYPNPNFLGSSSDSGRGTIRGFEWELSHLKSLGVKKELPVFITETGWAHDVDADENLGLDAPLISERLKNAYETAWKHPQVVAVTPFILNYRDTPFDIFSWKKKGGGFYEFFDMVKKLPKVKGEPKQHVSVEIVSVIFPPLFPGDGKINGGVAYIKNNGQSVWEGDEVIKTKRKGFSVEIRPKIIYSEVEPGHATLATFSIDL